MENEGSNFPLTYTKYVIQKRKMGEQPSKKSHQKKTEEPMTMGMQTTARTYVNEILV